MLIGVINFLLNTCYLKSNNIIYKQSEGSRRGCSIAGLSAEFLSRPLRGVICSRKKNIVFWRFYVDHIFRNSDKETLEELIQKINLKKFNI